MEWKATCTSLRALQPSARTGTIRQRSQKSRVCFRVSAAQLSALFKEQKTKGQASPRNVNQSVAAMVHWAGLGSGSRAVNGENSSVEATR